MSSSLTGRMWPLKPARPFVQSTRCWARHHSWRQTPMPAAPPSLSRNGAMISAGSSPFRAGGLGDRANVFPWKLQGTRFLPHPLCMKSYLFPQSHCRRAPVRSPGTCKIRLRASLLRFRFDLQHLPMRVRAPGRPPLTESARGLLYEGIGARLEEDVPRPRRHPVPYSGVQRCVLAHSACEPAPGDPPTSRRHLMGLRFPRQSHQAHSVTTLTHGGRGVPPTYPAKAPFECVWTCEQVVTAATPTRLGDMPVCQPSRRTPPWETKR